MESASSIVTLQALSPRNVDFKIPTKNGPLILEAQEVGKRLKRFRGVRGLPSKGDIFASMKKEKAFVRLGYRPDEFLFSKLAETAQGLVLGLSGLARVARAKGMTLKKLKSNLGMAPEHRYLVFISDMEHEEAHDTLLHEWVHLMLGDADLSVRDLRRYRVEMEITVQLMCLMFYPSSVIQNRIDFEYWNVNDAVTLQTYFRDAPQRDPNREPHLILEQLRESLRAGVRIAAGPHQVPIPVALLQKDA